MDFLQNNTQTLVASILIGAVGFWIRFTIKDIIEKSTDKVAGEVRRLTESLNSEITISTHERQTDTVWQQINQQHVSETSVEHERMIESLTEVARQNGKQTEVLQRISTILESK